MAQPVGAPGESARPNGGCRTARPLTFPAPGCLGAKIFQVRSLRVSSTYVRGVVRPASSRRNKPPPEGKPPRSALFLIVRVEICADVSEIRMCRFRRPLQGTSRDLANELERIRRSHPRLSPSPPPQLESLQSSSCFPRRRSSLTVRCGECRGRRTWTLCTRRGASMHAMPEGIDYGVIDGTAARGHGSFSRSTRAHELEHRLLKSYRR